MTLIIVDHRRVLPSKLTSAVSESILASLAFEVVGNLAWCGLTDIDDGTARKMLGSDLIHDRSPCRAFLCLRRKTSNNRLRSNGKSFARSIATRRITG